MSGWWSLAAAAPALLGAPAAAAAWRVGRERPGADFLERGAFALAGVALTCAAQWIAASVAGPTPVALLVASAAATILLLGVPLRRGYALPTAASAGTTRTVLAVSLLLVALGALPFAPHGWCRWDGVHHMAMTDWGKHFVVASALDASDRFPPPNPYLHTDPSGPYYYGFHLLAAALHRTAGRGVDLYPILLGLTLATLAMIPPVLFVVARGLVGSERTALLAAAAGGLLGGFDILPWSMQALGDAISAWPLPTGFAGLRAVVPSAHLDSWIHHDARQFNPFLVATIWAPHHVLAALIGLLALHALAPALQEERRSTHGFLLPAALLAALPALSTYVALAVAVALAAAVGGECLRLRRPPWAAPSFTRFAPAGALALVLALPSMLELGAVRGEPLLLSPSPAGGLRSGAVFSALLGGGWLGSLLDTPVVLVLELGVVALLGGRELVRRFRNGPSAVERQAATTIVAILVLVTLFRPPVDGPNNLYARSMLLVWSLLVPFAASGWRRGVATAATTGALLAALFMPLAVLGATLDGALFSPTPPDVVATAKWINAETPANAVVATDPDGGHGHFVYWLRRPQLVGQESLARLFGAAPERHRQVTEALREAFAAPDAARAAERFAALGVTWIVLGPRPADASDDTLPSWASPQQFEVAHRDGRFAVLRRVEPA